MIYESLKESKTLIYKNLVNWAYNKAFKDVTNCENM